jgi:Fe2+ or Zn2+ uptake regulation protein
MALEEWMESVRRETGYTLDEHLLELRGVWSNCREGQAA